MWKCSQHNILKPHVLEWLKPWFEQGNSQRYVVTRKSY